MIRKPLFLRGCAESVKITGHARAYGEKHADIDMQSNICVSNKALKRLSSPLSCEEGLLACKLRNVGLTYIIKSL